jgi:hypothetical protein
MKIRTDYVSNSSSSSFIIIVNSGTDRTEEIKSDFLSYKEDWASYPIPNTNGKHEFGWEWEDTSSFEGKLNFVGIQLLYLFMEKISNKEREYWSRPYTGKDFDRLYDMLQKVCKERFGFNVRLNPDVINTDIGFSEDRGGYYGFTTLADGYYIDHQSASSEGSCMEMFESEDALYDFLRFDESYIRGGNDNC